MLRISWRRFGVLHPFLIGAATLIVLFLGKLWPKYEFGLWTCFLAAIAIYLYVELRKPINYTSMAISEDAIDYSASGQRSVIRFDEIHKVQLMRERALFYSGIESKWVIHTLAGRRVELMDEWPHRRQLFQAFRKRLPDFDVTATKSGLKAWREGVWPCYESKVK